jgi:hypothetical protein
MINSITSPSSPAAHTHFIFYICTYLCRMDGRTLLRCVELLYKCIKNPPPYCFIFDAGGLCLLIVGARALLIDRLVETRWDFCQNNWILCIITGEHNGIVIFQCEFLQDANYMKLFKLFAEVI